VVRWWKGLCGTILCGLAMTPTYSRAEPPNACAGFYEAAKGDRSASDVYVSIKQSDQGSACFLVPRAVTDRQLRLLYRDGDPLAMGLAFDPVDLLKYISGESSIMVGSEKRVVDLDKLDCLTHPTPDSIDILPRAGLTPLTIETIKARAKEVHTDFPGYHRYSYSATEDYYFTEVQRGALASFWCGRVSGREVCSVAGDYDQMDVGITYQRKDMIQVGPERVRECVRAIGDLFRMPTQTQSQ
jgi:hypothetical protein